MATPELRHRSIGGRLSRRRLLRLTATAGLGLAGLELLAACQPAPAAPSSGGTATPAAPAAPAKASEPTPLTKAPLAVAQPSAAPTVKSDEVIKGGELVLGFREELPTLDPGVPNSAPQGRVVNLLFDPLVWQPDPGKYFPGLAESWEMAPDAKSFTFKLRKDVKFHDGTPFNAQSVKASFDRIVDPQLKSLQTGRLGPYDGTDVADEYTARVRFKSPFPLFLHHQSATGIRPVSPAAYQKSGADFGQHVVGTGPFMLKEFTKERIVMERFPDYKWGPEFLKYPGPAYLDRVVYRLIPEASTRIIALERGEVHYIDFVPEQEVKRLQGNPKLVVDSVEIPGVPQILQLNVTKAPLDDKKVRQAIQFAVDQQKIVDVLFFGVRKPAYSVLASSTLGYWKGSGEVYKFNPEKAKTLLTEAGWQPGPDGIRAKGGERFSILYITTDSPEFTRSAEIVQDMLKQVGIEMTVEAMTNAASLARYQLGEHHIGRLGNVDSDPSVMALPVHSRNIKGGTQGNRSKYSNPEVDAKLDAAEIETDQPNRLKMYEELQKTVADEAFILGTFEQTLVFARLKEVQDPLYASQGAHFLSKTWLKK